MTKKLTRILSRKSQGEIKSVMFCIYGTGRMREKSFTNSDIRWSRMIWQDRDRELVSSRFQNRSEREYEL